MAEHNCMQEEKLGAMRSSGDRIEKAMFNGEGGIIKMVPVLTNEVEQLTEAVSSLRTVVSGFAKFQNEIIGSKKTIKNMTPWLTIIVAILALGFTVYNNNRVNKIKYDQEYADFKLQFKQDKTIIDSTVRGGYRTYQITNDTIK